MAKNITDFSLYRWRYKLSYGALALLTLGLLGIAGFLIPGGLSTIEMSTVVHGADATINALKLQQPERILHLPYHLLQNASIMFFGVNAFAIKLPSLILAALSTIFLYGLLRLWFRPNVAIITTIITITTGQFLMSAQLGAPLITYLFWNVAILFCASMLARGRKYRPTWLLLTAIFAGLAAYAPFELYIVIALLVTSIVHPHARFIVFKQPLWAIIASVALFGALIVPLIFGLITKPLVIFSLLGIPSSFNDISWSAIGERMLRFIDFSGSLNATSLTPIFSLGFMLLALIGVYRLLSAKYTAKSYILTIWIVLIIPALLFSPRAIGLVILPLSLLIAFAFDYLIRSWYRLFPHNPYARVAGLIPLAVLMIGIALSNLDQYIYGYQYSPGLTSSYSKDLSLLNTTLKNYPNRPIMLLVDSEDAPFYQLLASRSPNQTISVKTEFIPSATTSTNPVIIASYNYHIAIHSIPNHIVVDSTSEKSNRFYVYENGAS